MVNYCSGEDWEAYACSISFQTFSNLFQMNRKIYLYSDDATSEWVSFSGTLQCHYSGPWGDYVIYSHWVSVCADRGASGKYISLGYYSNRLRRAISLLGWKRKDKWRERKSKKAWSHRDLNAKALDSAQPKATVYFIFLHSEI